MTPSRVVVGRDGMVARYAQDIAGDPAVAATIVVVVAPSPYDGLRALEDAIGRASELVPDGWPIFVGEAPMSPAPTFPRGATVFGQPGRHRAAEARRLDALAKESHDRRLAPALTRLAGGDPFDHDNVVRAAGVIWDGDEPLFSVQQMIADERSHARALAGALFARWAHLARSADRRLEHGAAFLDLLDREAEPRVIAVLLRCLADELPEPFVERALPRVRSLATHADAGVRIGAAWALLAARSPEATEVLAALATDAVSRVRFAAIDALSDRDRSRARALLLPELEARWHELDEPMLFAVWSCAGPDLVPALERAAARGDLDPKLADDLASAIESCRRGHAS